MTDMTVQRSKEVGSNAVTKGEEKKSWSQMFLDRARAEMANAPPTTATTYLREAGSTGLEYVEGGVVGSMLGAAHAKFGLDGKVGPADGWLAAVGAVLGVALSGHLPHVAARARGVGSKAFTVLAFRRSYELAAHAPLGGRATPGVQRIALPGQGHGIAGEDPIERVAKELG